jgi:hypothetical protein
LCEEKLKQAIINVAFSPTTLNKLGLLYLFKIYLNYLGKS